ncbi:unnamed protein product [Ectocarpus sp. CCAP 1310/34]|nr:unnamed protein product [Ectocarpus sp. CCAP 1310/34]
MASTLSIERQRHDGNPSDRQASWRQPVQEEQARAGSSVVGSGAGSGRGGSGVGSGRGDSVASGVRSLEHPHVKLAPSAPKVWVDEDAKMTACSVTPMPWCVVPGTGLISPVIYIVKISPLQLEIPMTILMVSYMRS